MSGRPFIGIILLVGLVAGCTDFGEPPKDVVQTDKPQQELYDATITFYQGNRVSGLLKSGRIRKFERTSQILLDSGIVMDFYNEEGRHTSTLWADSGLTDEARKDMVAMGNVIARSDSGQMLETSHLRWDNRLRQVRSDVRVKLSTPTDTIYGIGFLSDEHLRNWRIDQPQGLTFREREKRSRSEATEPSKTVPVEPDTTARDSLQ